MGRRRSKKARFERRLQNFREVWAASNAPEKKKRRDLKG